MTHREALHNLWITCFPEDGDGFARRFLTDYYTPEQATFIAGADGTLESALYWLPCTYTLPEKTGTLLYIYAMGTHPDYRRRGNLRTMLHTAEQYCLHHGMDGLILHAMATSKSGVERFGMKPLVELGQETVILPDRGTPVWCDGTFADFARLRWSYLAGLDSRVGWDDRELAFIYADLCTMGKMHFFTYRGHLHYGILQGQFVEETDCLEGLLSQLSGTVTVRHPGRGVYAAHVKTYTQTLTDEALGRLYFNLMLQ